MRRAGVVVAVIAFFAILSFLPAVRSLAQETGGQVARVLEVFVTNWPDRFAVSGEVTVTGGPLRQAVLVTRDGITIPPSIPPRDANRLIPGGSVEVDGFPALVLSLTGQIKGQVLKAGSVGAILLPDVETVTEAFDQKGEFLFPLEVTAASVAGASPYFASNQPRYAAAFPRYRVFFYNTSDRTVTVSLYAYLTQ